MLSGHRHAEWVTPSLAARQLRQRPYGRYVPIGRLFSGNPSQMQWLKDVFGDVATLFLFLLTEYASPIPATPLASLLTPAGLNRTALSRACAFACAASWFRAGCA